MLFLHLPPPHLARFLLGLAIMIGSGCGKNSGPAPPTLSTPTTAATVVSAVPDQNLSKSSEPPQPVDAWMEDVTPRTGIDFTYRNGREAGLFTILETVGGGVAMVDLDRDGDLDLVFAGGGTIAADPPATRGAPSGIYRNNGGFRFTEVTGAAGLRAESDYSHGCIAGDCDGDGWTDLLLTCYGRSRLYRNMGDGTLDDVTSSSGLDFNTWATAAAWGDFDLDGLADILLVSYVDWKLDPAERCFADTPGGPDTCPPQRYPATASRLFRNRGDGTFEDDSRADGMRTDGKGLGVIVADLNADGRLDAYVANDQVENHLYLGRAPRGFQEGAVAAGVSGNEYGIPEGSMGVDTADIDGDGRLDLFVTNFELEDNSVYLNQGHDLFEHATVRCGLGGMGRTDVGFGTVLSDLNADGWPDLVIINGHVSYHRGLVPWKQRPLLLENRRGRFEEIARRGSGGPWFQQAHAGRGLAVGDLDGDGMPDLVVTRQNSPASILRNCRPARPWLRIELVGTSAERQAIGAVVTIDCGDRVVTQGVKSGEGYLSTSDRRLLFYVGESGEGARPIEIQVRWPGGRTEVFSPGRDHTDLRLVEGHGKAA